VVVAHNQYVSGQPSGENAVVAAEMDDLAAAGITVLPFVRSSDEIPTLPLGQRASLPVSPIYAGRAQRELLALLRRERPHVLHLHNPYPLLSPWVVRTAQRQGVPVVHTLHNYRQTCVNGLHLRDGAACHDCVGSVVAWPAVRHGCYRGSRAQSTAMAAALAAHRGTWRRLDRVIALTPAMAEYAQSLGIDRARVVVKPNTVPDPGPSEPPGDGFLFAGRLGAEKGVAVLLEAWRRHGEGERGTLRVAGDGPLAGLVREHAARRADVEYLGPLSPDKVTAAMRRCRVVLVPSTWAEVCPRVVIEAMANGRPVLGTNLGGVPWLIGAEEPTPAGWAVDPTPAALADGLRLALLAADDAGVAARLRYERSFAPSIATATLIRTYEDVARAEGTL
jgi:glycosyltransferase involved in cell wall biosynthesis